MIANLDNYGLPHYIYSTTELCKIRACAFILDVPTHTQIKWRGDKPPKCPHKMCQITTSQPPSFNHVYVCILFNNNVTNTRVRACMRVCVCVWVYGSDFRRACQPMYFRVNARQKHNSVHKQRRHLNSVAPRARARARAHTQTRPYV